MFQEKSDKELEAEVQKGNGKGGKTRKGRAKKATKDPVVGRKDHDGQEATIDVTALKKIMPKAIKVEEGLLEASADASEAFKRWAKETGCNATELRAAAKAYAKEEVEAKKRKADQLSLIFTECDKVVK